MTTPEDPRDQPAADPAPEPTDDAAAEPEEAAAEPTERVAAEPTDDAAAEPAEEAAPESTTVYARRRGAPTLTSWVLLCLAVPAVATLVIAPLLGVSGLTPLLNLAIVAVLGLGFPAAAVIALVDGVIHRRRRRK